MILAKIGLVNNAANFTADSQVCPGEPVQFVCTTPFVSTEEWFFGDGQSTSAQNPSHIYAKPGFYSVELITTYKQSALVCVDSLRKLNYINIDSPVVSFYDTTNFAPCPPFPVRFFNTSPRTGLTYMWDFINTTNSTLAPDTSSVASPLHVFLYPGNYTVVLTATDSFGCSTTRDSVNMILVQGPVGEFIVSPDTGCVPLTVTIRDRGNSYLASSILDLGDGTPSLADTFNLTHVYDSVGSFPIVFTLADTLGCHVSYPLGPVAVGAYPNPDLRPDTTMCAGNSVQFNLTQGNYFLWTADKTPNYLSCDTCPDPTSNAPPDTITYYVTVSTSFGCVTKDTETVNIVQLAQIDKPEFPYELCPNDTFQVTIAHGQPYVVWLWTPDSFISATNIPNPLIWSPDTITYFVLGTSYFVNGPGDTGTCATGKEIPFIPIHKVLATTGFADTTVCQGVTVDLYTLVSQASSIDTAFDWTPTKYLNFNNRPDITATPPPGDYYYMDIVSSRGCVSDTDSVHIVVIQKPDLEAGTSQFVTPGTTVQLYAASHDNVNYQWKPAADSLTCTTCSRPFITVSQTQVVYVTVEGENGCSTSDSVILQVVGCNGHSVFVPNTFTPNNDGLNDRLYVRGAGLTQLEYFRIFDRWGQMVFQTQDIAEGWDGSTGGKPDAINTYVYMLKAVCSSGEVVSLQGNVTLIR